MPTKSRLSFPTKFAREQNYYEVKNGTKMYIFDHITQFIYKVSFKLGQVSGDGLDEYVYKSYSSVEKRFFVNNYDILFSRRDYREVGAPATEYYKCQVNTAPREKNLDGTPDYTNAQIPFERRISPDYESYTFLNDQLVYDPQLDDMAFRNKKGFDILKTGITEAIAPNLGVTYPVVATSTASVSESLAENSDKTEVFLDYATQKSLSESVMKDKAWIRRFAQKHFLFIFKANNVNPTPRIFYGFPVKELRIHPYDQVKY